MKAAVQSSYGPPDVVRIAEVDRPTAKDDELLVKVHVTTVNRTDCAYRAAKPFFIRPFSGLFRPKATVPGTEFSGTVEALGREVRSFQVGDRVFGYVEGRFGAHAEYLTVPQDGSVAAMPDNVTFDEAAAGTEGSHYALSFIRKAKISSGQSVLINGATGGIGSAAVQLVKNLGVDVTAVCGTEHVELVRTLGADRVVDYTAEDFTSDERTYDVVLDAVGKSTFWRCKRLLKPRGIYSSSELGPWGQNPLLALISPLSRGRRVVFAIPQDNQEIVIQLRDLLESGAFRPVIDRRYPLNQIAEAHRYVESGQKVGNVLITVSDPSV